MTVISYVNMCPTQKMNGPEILRATFVYFISAEFCPVSRRWKLPDYSPDDTAFFAPLPFSVLQHKRAVAVRFHMYCSIIQAINAN